MGLGNPVRGRHPLKPPPLHHPLKPPLDPVVTIIYIANYLVVNTIILGIFLPLFSRFADDVDILSHLEVVGVEGGPWLEIGVWGNGEPVEFGGGEDPGLLKQPAVLFREELGVRALGPHQQHPTPLRKPGPVVFSHRLRRQVLYHVIVHHLIG